MRFRIAATGLLFMGCYSSGEGQPPPLDRIYFPVGLAVDQSKQRLYVASSDFDLQYNAGSLQSIDLTKVRKKLLDSCDKLGEQTAAERATVPGRCKAVPLSEVQFKDDPSPDALPQSFEIGAFATDIQLRYSPDYGHGKLGRLFIPVRGEASLNWIDVMANGDIRCGQTKDSPRCDGNHRVGTNKDANTRELRMPAEPYGIAINDEGDAIAITHQTTGEVSLFTQDVRTENGWKAGPQLGFIQPDLPGRALAVAHAPLPLIAQTARLSWLMPEDEPLLAGLERPLDDPYPPGFLVTYGNVPQLDLLRAYTDAASSPARPYLQLAASVAINALSMGSDSRGIAFDDSERQACEEACPVAAGNPSSWTEAGIGCLQNCAAMPIGVYVANRAPPSLLIGSTIADTWATPNRDVPRFHDVVALPAGPSRVYVGKVIGDSGELETRVFALCFDQKRIAIYDPLRRNLEAYVTTGRGPHALAFDNVAAADGTQARALAYVAHFTDSYVGVIELDRRKQTYAEIVLNLGSAVPPRASK